MVVGELMELFLPDNSVLIAEFLVEEEPTATYSTGPQTLFLDALASLDFTLVSE